MSDIFMGSYVII